MTGPAAPAAARVAIAATMTARSNALLASQARRGPRRTATESTPAAASRSLSALALAMASAAPAATATGTRTAKARGRVPVTPSQPKTGSNGIPTANGSQDQAVPLATRS